MRLKSSSANARGDPDGIAGEEEVGMVAGKVTNE